MAEKQSSTHYQTGKFYDEMFESDNTVRPHYEAVYQEFVRMNPAKIEARQQSMNRRMVEEGITFTLYTPEQKEPLERTIPFDMIPRIITAQEWSLIESGLKQRVQALNLFNRDIYHGQRILKDGVVPRGMILGHKNYCMEMAGLSVPNDVYVTTAGIDVIRDEKGHFMVLEDNLRTPSGFSYLYKSRMLMDQLFPELLDACHVRDVEQSLNRFLRTLRSIAPSGKQAPVIALLSPGYYNSAYYEHTYLAQQMGIYLVEGRDLTVKDHKVYMRSIHGLRQVDVIYRRIDDDYLDPLAFNPNSMLGVPGLMNAYRAGNVAIANAPGTGVSDDKAVYTYVPDMIRYYLNEEPLLDNVETYLLTRPEDRDYVLANLERLVVKETSLSGGYGMLIGPASTLEQRKKFTAAILAEPERYIAQPTVQLSRSPILLNGLFVPRHVDLRAFVLTGRETHVIPGGLSRVAMTEGSLVVNSSQGGGCKDTWVLSR
ncbi:MAG: circularly permuted type 2 ATP-grasp protein [Gorillibacterium sp.]|nr:circularly permuted type 2 ATP-grasp protein [Gorillibacterium sp.]